MPGYTIEEVENFAEQYIQEIIDNVELDIEIYKVHAHGSRIYGNANEKSDLDFVIFYNGNEKEDSLFNIFNEEPYYIENISCDFNPIRLEGNSRLYWNKQIQQYINNNDIDYNKNKYKNI